MCDLLKNSTKKNVVEISGAVGASAAIDRAKGFREKMGDCGITITDSQTGNWGVPDSKAVMAAFLKKSTDIQGVFAHNDEEAIGAIQAIQEAGLAALEGAGLVSVVRHAGRKAQVVVVATAALSSAAVVAAGIDTTVTGSVEKDTAEAMPEPAPSGD